MPSSYSTALRLELIATGEQSGSWGTTTNTNLGTLLEQAIAGVASITMTDANYTLTSSNGASDQARNAAFIMTGTLTASRNVVVPTSTKLYIVKNGTTGGFSIVVKTSAGTGVTVLNGKHAIVYCDGTNVVDVSGNIGALIGANNLSDVANAATARTNLGVAIGTDVQAYDANTAIGPGSSTANYVPQWNSTDGKTLKAGLAVGTAANNLVQLDGSAKLPAVDGSQLTNLSAGPWSYVSTVNLNSDTYVDMTGLAAGYDYLIVVQNVLCGPNTFSLRCGTGGSPTWDTGTNYAFGVHWDQASGAAITNYGGGNDGDTAFYMTNDQSYSIRELNGEILVIEPGSTAGYKGVFWGCSAYSAAAGHWGSYRGGGAYKSTTAVTGLRLFINGGHTFTSGKIRLYRRKTT